MSAIPVAQNYLTEAEYLAAEAISSRRHEYLNGVVYAMAGGSPIHSILKVNLIERLSSHLRGRPCRPFDSDMKLRLRRGLDVRHYYPDAMVVCRPQLREPWQENPLAVFEVTSPETERTDRGEKLDAYRSIPSLRLYALIDSNEPAVVLHLRREDEWETRLLRQPEEVIELPDFGPFITLQQLYAETELV